MYYLVLINIFKALECSSWFFPTVEKLRLWMIFSSNAITLSETSNFSQHGGASLMKISMYFGDDISNTCFKVYPFSFTVS